MKAKAISITLTQYTYQKYIEGLEGNRSKFIEEMIIRGVESYDEKNDNLQVKLLQAHHKIRELEEQIKHLNNKIITYKSHINNISNVTENPNNIKILKEITKKLENHKKLDPELEQKAGREYNNPNEYLIIQHKYFKGKTGENITIQQFKQLLDEVQK